MKTPLHPNFPNSAFVRAPERLVLKGGRWQVIDIPVRYGRFDHPVAGRCLIDTGYSMRVTRGRRSLPLTLYAGILRPRLTPQALPTAHPQIDTILLTHLHADHVSALLDYPAARIIADASAARHFLDGGWFARTHKGMFRELLPAGFLDRITGFDAFGLVDAPLGMGPARDIFGDGTVLAVALPGHMRGHTGFLFPHEDRVTLYAGDADWLHAAILDERSPGAPAKWILDDQEAAKTTSARLRAFHAAGGRIILCHDPESLP